MILNNIILIINKEIKRKENTYVVWTHLWNIYTHKLNITYPMQKVQPTFKPLSVTRHVSRISPTIKRDHSGIIIISGNRSIELAIEKNASLNHVILLPFYGQRRAREKQKPERVFTTLRFVSHHIMCGKAQTTDIITSHPSIHIFSPRVPLTPLPFLSSL